MTSNESFNRLYPNVQNLKPKTFDAFMARIHYVYDFNDTRQMMFQNDIPRENPLMPEHLKQKPEQMTLITDEKTLAELDDIFPN